MLSLLSELSKREKKTHMVKNLSNIINNHRYFVIHNNNTTEK